MRAKTNAMARKTGSEAPASPVHVSTVGISTVRVSTAGALAGLLSLLVAAAFLLSGVAGPGRTAGLLLLVCLAFATILVVRRMAKIPAAPAVSGYQAPTGNLLDSASAAMLAIGLDGELLYVNSAAERLLGYEPGQLKERNVAEILAPGEGPRLMMGEMQKLCKQNLSDRLLDDCGQPIDFATDAASHGLTARPLERMATRPPDLTSSFETQLQHRDGRFAEAMLHVTGLRDSSGAFYGLMAVAGERGATQQKQHEHRLALQLLVSQIVGENASAEATATRVLEALCVAQGWKLGIAWLVNAKQNHLDYLAAWSVPGRHAESLIRESARLTLPSGADLPGRAWKEARTVWIAELGAAPPSPRLHAARRHEMVSGWAVPVRAGRQVLAVLEFYSSVRLGEDCETVAAVETAAASLGQMLARAQESGRAEELSRQQQILLDSIADGICGVDRQGLVSFANRAAAHMLGAPAAQLTGTPVHELLHGAIDGADCGDDCAVRNAAANQNPVAGEVNVVSADGSSFPAEYVLTPIVDQGRFSGSVLSFRDISQRSALDRLKDEFISTVSHELRTPLTSIRGALGLLSSGVLGDVNEKAANLLRIALTNSDRLVRLTNDILDLERIQSGREPLAFHPVQLAEIVGQAIEGMQPVADAAGVQLLHNAAQAQIWGDPDRLLQVFTNLLSNAIKFSPPSSTVSILLRPDNDDVTVSVIDHGRGIPADKLESIFGRFQQVDASDSRQKGGSGLGLAICRMIVMQHSGRIWAERNPLRGSTFRVYFPCYFESIEPLAGEQERVQPMQA